MLAVCAVAFFGLADSVWAQAPPLSEGDALVTNWPAPTSFVSSVAHSVPEWERGHASWYSSRFAGKRTASGEPYRQDAFTAAHRSLPMDTMVTVRNPKNNREVVVRINDRGPRHENRLIGLSRAAARALGMLHQGVGVIELKLTTADASEPQPVRSERKARSSAGSWRPLGGARKPNRD